MSCRFLLLYFGALYFKNKKAHDVVKLRGQN